MIINLDKNEKKIETINKNNLEKEQITNEIEETSSLENFSGEEEDEDDLLKNDTENNNSDSFIPEEIYISPLTINKLNTDIDNTENNKE